MKFVRNPVQNATKVGLAETVGDYQAEMGAKDLASLLAAKPDAQRVALRYVAERLGITEAAAEAQCVAAGLTVDTEP